MGRYRFWAGLVAVGVVLLTSPLVASAVVPYPAPQLADVSSFYDAHNVYVGSVNQAARMEVPLSRVPSYVTRALVATEDASFYQNAGVNPISLARAALVNLRSGGLVQGGSTLTQQLAKNLFLTQEKSFWRKLVEAVLSLKLTATYTKDQLLTMYLNTVYLI